MTILRTFRLNTIEFAHEFNKTRALAITLANVGNMSV